MKHVNDRGTKKWTAMMLPEHEEMLRQLWREQDYKEKPILDEQKQADINDQLQLAISQNRTVDITYYDHELHDILNISNQHINIHQKAGSIQLYEESMAIPLQDILDAAVN